MGPRNGSLLDLESWISQPFFPLFSATAPSPELARPALSEKDRGGGEGGGGDKGGISAASREQRFKTCLKSLLKNSL